MATPLIVTAGSWRTDNVPCTFTVAANGVALAPAKPGGISFDLPSGTTAVTITAKPTVATYWPTTVELTASGTTLALAATSPGLATVVNLGGPAKAFALVVVTVSRFKDVTKDIVTLLQTVPVPRGANAPPESELRSEYGAWPPPDLDVGPVPGARYVDPADPVVGGKLNFGAATSIAVNVDTAVLELAGVPAPRLFGVTWPKAIAPKVGAAPMPTLLFFRQTGGQDAIHGVFTGGAAGASPYPYNFDYAERCLFESMHYAATPLKKVGGWTLRPKGVPYQIARAGKPVVAVYPVASAVDKVGFGVLGQMKEAGRILEDLQAFMFWRARIATPPSTVGDTAMAFYSSIGYWLPDWLDNAANLRSTFLKDTVKAIYLLDPPNFSECVAAGLRWSKATDGKKRVRLYSRFQNDTAHRLMFGKAAPARPYVVTSPDGKNTAAVLPEASWELLVGTPLEDWDVHHFVPATMLTHAIALDF